MAASRLDFSGRVTEADPAAHRCTRIRTLMLNVGRRCQLACSHCHHRCSPEATETMSADVAEAAIELARELNPDLVDVTGGSPELWPLLPDFVRLAEMAGLRLRLRTNLISLADPDNDELASMLATHHVTVLASLPGTSEETVGATRGAGVFDKSLRALEVLSRLGYGANDGPPIELAWNPLDGLPRPEAEVEREVCEYLEPLGVRVDRVRAIANAPLGKYRDSLRQQDSLEPYLIGLADAFDAAAIDSLPCREGVEVSWDGTLHDCDFNLAAGMPLVEGPRTVHSALADPGSLIGRRIAFATHCFACTVGGGSG